jgi:hypothetical protein
MFSQRILKNAKNNVVFFLIVDNNDSTTYDTYGTDRFKQILLQNIYVCDANIISKV